MKPRIAIVGAGIWPVRWLQPCTQAGYVIDQIVSRGRAACSQRARRLAGELGSYAVTAARAQLMPKWFGFVCPIERSLLRRIAERGNRLRGKRLAFQRRSQQRTNSRACGNGGRGGRIGSSADDVCSRLAAVAGGGSLRHRGRPESGACPLAPLSRICVGSRFSFASKTKRPTTHGDVRFSVTNRAAGGERESGRNPLGFGERSKRGGCCPS